MINRTVKVPKQHIKVEFAAQHNTEYGIEMRNLHSPANPCRKTCTVQLINNNKS